MFQPKDQIAYVPDHAQGDVDHSDVEYGFVTSIQSANYVFCRYWLVPGESLRTKANGELTPVRNLQKIESVDPEIVDQFIRKHNIWIPK